MHDEVTSFRGWRQDPVISELMRARARNQGREPGDEIEWVEHDRRGAVLPVPAQAVDDTPIAPLRETLGRDRRSGKVSAQTFDRVAMALDLDLGMEREALDVAAQFTRQEERPSWSSPRSGALRLRSAARKGIDRDRLGASAFELQRPLASAGVSSTRSSPPRGTSIVRRVFQESGSMDSPGARSSAGPAGTSSATALPELPTGTATLNS